MDKIRYTPEQLEEFDRAAGYGTPPPQREAPAMTDLTREQLDALRDAAEKATMGPWSYHGPDCCEDDDSDCDATGPEAQVMYYGDSSGQCIAETWANADAHFIAAANPQTILALLDAADERDTLQQERDAARAAVEKLAVAFGASVENDEDCSRCPLEAGAGYSSRCSTPGIAGCAESLRTWAYAPATAQDAPHNNTAAKETPQCEHQEPDAQ